ncbi:MAG: DNA-binding protein [Sulfurimonas sp.]|uniref:DNA-binding protein n=1 Tax=Sulfurimonas sp. TaxID=2022749 RepID=UPI0026171226|nr:DNA-binding protein [Sulfurimonas sp.]MCW8894567.1 DNA-binding protein [Sulfurimonas sp.]MCW8953773.1 DNA-binding protein [Sulfurimonas sp.]MCW9067519.1 DNA-binding protein [Sulfurimonas sp.]
MSKLTVTDAAQMLGVSKEAIHNRVRRGSLKSVVENGVKMVILDGKDSSKASSKRVTKKAISPVDDRYYKLLEEQNAKLQQKIETLESETRTLRDQKEQMLIDERKKIEQIYKDKDEQLKNILNAISSKFMLNAPDDALDIKEELVEAEIEEPQQYQDSGLISLNKYIKTREFSKKKSSKIKEKFKKRADTDARIITIGKKYYIDLEKYDYSDLSL